MNSIDSEIASVLNRLAILEEEGLIRLHYMPLSGYIGGFTYKSKRGIYHVIVNENLSFEYQHKVKYHEAAHILKHGNSSYSICELNEDGQDYSVYEASADKFMETCFKYVAATRF